MKRYLNEYLVARVVEGEVIAHHILEVGDLSELRKVLQTIYLLEPDEIKIQGNGFQYITNQTHWQAADYPVETFIKGFETLHAPVYTNEPFFEILRSRKVEST